MRKNKRVPCLHSSGKVTPGIRLGETQKSGRGREIRERRTERASGQQPGSISYTCVCRFAGTRDATRAYIDPA